MIKLLLEGFDPMKNQLDRHLLFEVTGLELIKDEFKGDDSSDSDSE